MRRVFRWAIVAVNLVIVVWMVYRIMVLDDNQLVPPAVFLFGGLALLNLLAILFLPTPASPLPFLSYYWKRRALEEQAKIQAVEAEIEKRRTTEG